MNGIDHATLQLGEAGIYINVEPIRPPAPAVEASCHIIVDVRAPKTDSLSVSAHGIHPDGSIVSIDFQLLPPPAPTYTYAEAPQLHGTANVYWSSGKALYSDNRTQIRGPLVGLDWTLTVKLMHSTEGGGSSAQETLIVEIVQGRIRTLALATPATGYLSGFSGSSLRELAGEQLTQALNLVETGRCGEAVVALDEYARHWKGVVGEYSKGLLANALAAKACATPRHERTDESMATGDGPLPRFPESVLPYLRWSVARALYSKGLLLEDLGRADDAVAAYGEVMRQFSEGDDPDLSSIGSGAEERRAWVLAEIADRERGDGEEMLARASAAYDKLAERYGDPSRIISHRETNGALFAREAYTLRLLSSDAGAHAWHTFADRLAGVSLTDARTLAVRASFNAAYLKQVMHQLRRSVPLYQNAVEHFGGGEKTSSSKYLGRCLLGKGECLAVLGQDDLALAAYDDVVHRFGDDGAEEDVVVLVCSALLARGHLMAELHKREEAIEAYSQVLSRLNRADGSSFAEIRAVAREDRAFELADEPEAAVALLKKAGRVAERTTRKRRHIVTVRGSWPQAQIVAAVYASQGGHPSEVKRSQWDAAMWYFCLEQPQ